MPKKNKNKSKHKNKNTKISISLSQPTESDKQIKIDKNEVPVFVLEVYEEYWNLYSPHKDGGCYGCLAGTLKDVLDIVKKEAKEGGCDNLDEDNEE